MTTQTTFAVAQKEDGKPYQMDRYRMRAIYIYNKRCGMDVAKDAVGERTAVGVRPYTNCDTTVSQLPYARIAFGIRP